MTNAPVVRAVATAIVGAAIAWALYLARNILLLVYVSMLFAIGLGPMVHRIEQSLSSRNRRLPRSIAILVIYLTIVAVLTLVGLSVVPPLVTQAQDLWRNLPSLLARGQDLLVRAGLLSHPITLEEAVRSGPGTGNAVGRVATAVTLVAGGIFTFITILILTFYLLVESETLIAGFTRLFPYGERSRVDTVAHKVSAKVSAWLNGQLILAGSIGLSGAIGLYLLGVPYFYVLALLCAVGEVIPVVGPIFAAVPAILAGLSVSPRTALFVALFMLAQQQFENHVLVPKVMQRQVGVSPVIVIIALLIGGSLMGIFGAILAVPTAAILQVAVEEMLTERDRLAEERLGPRFDNGK